MKNKFWVAFVVVFGVWVIAHLLIHSAILGSTYSSEELMKVWRPDMQSKMWIYFVVGLITCFMFTVIFSKGYQGKGVGEGFRYGVYMGILLAVPMAYGSYASYNIPYSLALQWFIYGFIQYVILGIVVGIVYGKKPSEAPAS